MKHQTDHHLEAIWKGAMILTVAGILVKVLSAAYRVPFQNIVGDVGFYIYQQVYPFYGIAIILSTYGFPVVISKLIAEHPEVNKTEAAKKIGTISFVFLLFLGGLLFLFLYFGADAMAGMMGDPKLTQLIGIVAFSFLLMPFLSVGRGIFQGRGEMTPTAVSQVSEQLIRVCAILVLSYLLVKHGHSLYEVGAGAMVGSVGGGLAAVAVLFFFYQRHQATVKHLKNPPVFFSTGSIVRALLLQGFTICISSLLLVLFQMVDSFSVYAYLVGNGSSSDEAKLLKGIYDRGQPLIQLGTVLATAFSLSLVPFITRAKTHGSLSEMKDKMMISIRVSIAIGAAASVGLAWLIRPVNMMLFSNGNGSGVLLVLGFSILFCSIALTASAILQGLGHAYLPAFYVLAGVLVKILLNVAFIPGSQTMGAALSTLLASGVVAGGLLLEIKRKTGITIMEKAYIYPLLVSIALMSATLAVFLEGSLALVGTSRLLASAQSLIGVMLGGIVFLFVLVKNNYFTKTELSFLPLGKKLGKLIK